MDFAKKIKNSTEEIFSTMVFMPLCAGDPLSEDVEIRDCHLSAMIGLSGDLTSMLSIHCPGPVGMAITGEMLGMDVEEIDEDVKDTLGEISNMVAGGLKESFSQENIHLELSIPTTVAGSGYKVSSPSGNRVVIPFDVESGRFFIEMKYSLS